jgi:hypothetical protein
LAFGQADVAVDVIVPRPLYKVGIGRANFLVDRQFGKPGARRAAQFREDRLAVEQIGAGGPSHGTGILQIS